MVFHLGEKIHNKVGQMKIYGFHHICLEKNGKEVFEEQLTVLRDSGLYESCETIFCSVLGPRGNYELPSKYKIIYESKEGNSYERPVLEFMYEFSLKNEGKYFYIHTKGISHYGTDNYVRAHDWRVFMEYFLLKNWRRCVKDLDQYDVAGVNYKPSPPHFSGNFWWTNSIYVKRNKPQFDYKDYYETEMWVLKGSRVVGISYHDSKINHYESRYLPAKYENEPQVPVVFSPGLSEASSNTGVFSEKLDFHGFESVDPGHMLPPPPWSKK